MRKLKAQGLIYATTHMRDQKYLYLLHPSKAGEQRKREYIGTDTKRIDAAIKSIERGKSYDALHKQLKSVDVAISEASHMLAEAVGVLEKL